jgi:Fe-S-cluster containining protein
MTYLQLLGQLDNWFAKGVAAAGPGVVPCRVGCTACCHGPFDISPADAQDVHSAVSALPTVIREGVLERASVARERSAEFLPTWGPPWDADTLSEAMIDDLCESQATLPCPALDPDGGSCLIHEARPATCRLTGLGLDASDGLLLENVCPIQGEFPAYASLEATPFDLLRFEREAERWDDEARREGWVSTTVAGALDDRR